MNRGRREALILGAAGVAATAAGFLIGPALLHSFMGEGKTERAKEGSTALGSATFVDLAGTPRRLDTWLGQILVCNFWATWCAPCREEIPLLMEARRKYGPGKVEIVGISVDNPDKVREFTASLKISYPILLAEGGGLDLMRKLGNTGGGLPYTVVAGRDGGIVHRKLGAYRRDDLDLVLGPLTRA